MSTFLIVTSIAKDDHPVLRQFAEDTVDHGIRFILIGDNKSPKEFHLPGCDFFSVERQLTMGFSLKDILPFNHYARKNLGYLQAIKEGADCIIETDDDNIPYPQFWEKRILQTSASLVEDSGWVNVYKYFTDENVWPRGFHLGNILEDVPQITKTVDLTCPIQQGLADDNPDVDAIYRLTNAKAIQFLKRDGIALGKMTFCPFNSQNTTWFPDAFPLLYLPSFCSFRMTDIWRSFVAQRIAWACDWPILFHNSTVRQERNMHNLMHDFRDEVIGYVNNDQIMESLNALTLKSGVNFIPENMRCCYERLVSLGVIGAKEMELLDAWLSDLHQLG